MLPLCERLLLLGNPMIVIPLKSTVILDSGLVNVWAN